jgi:hypothetical protein
MTALFGVVFWMWFIRGRRPTSRVTITYQPIEGLIENITCSLDLLGLINPELQDEFKKRATSKVPLIEMLQK